MNPSLASSTSAPELGMVRKENLKLLEIALDRYYLMEDRAEKYLGRNEPRDASLDSCSTAERR
jgi:hypothetical protein